MCDENKCRACSASLPVKRKCTRWLCEERPVGPQDPRTDEERLLGGNK